MPPADGYTTASFDALLPASGPRGQLAHPLAVAHLSKLEKRLYPVGTNAWCLVGNGLSNQTFVRGPEGIIAIDTGECMEEMQAALDTLRTVTDEPLVACIYTHFHYVNGTRAIVEAGYPGITIYGHAGIPENLARFSGEIAPRSGIGIVRQFGTALPAEGADGLLHCGLGLSYRNPDHAPYTPGYLPAQVQITEPESFSIAGLKVVLTPAPSDATDSITIHFPELDLVVNNLVWPGLFNVYAIRGEAYRDPQVVTKGIDHILSLQPEHLIATHGPPLEEDIQVTMRDYRDAIQFIWDQSVRAFNLGMTPSEACHQIRLPETTLKHFSTQQLYGLAEHHVRQVYSGLFGWFEGIESELLCMHPEEKYRRLVAGFGGRRKVRSQARQALKSGDLRWALELTSWLVYSPRAGTADNALMASVLTEVAQHTPSANLRNWALTRASELRGETDLSRLQRHRFSYRAVMAQPPARYVHTLRVLLDPARAKNLDCHLAWRFADGTRAGLHFRNQVAVPTDGTSADLEVFMSHETWASILSSGSAFWDAVAEGTVSVAGDAGTLKEVLSALDLSSLH